MIHGIYRVTAFEITAPYTLRIDFADGVSRTIDFRPVLGGEMYGPLLDLDVFNDVELDTEVGTLVWPNGADFDPATLHDWPQVVDDFVLMAQRWQRSDKRSAG